jgi:hypothetical protein
VAQVEQKIAALVHMEVPELRAAWRRLLHTEPPARLGRDLLARGVAYKMQERVRGGLSKATLRKLRAFAERLEADGDAILDPGPTLKPGTKLVREWRGVTHSVVVLESGFDFDGQRYRSLSKIARDITGARWSGPRFFGLTRERTSRSVSSEGADD